MRHEMREGGVSSANPRGNDMPRHDSTSSTYLGHIVHRPEVHHLTSGLEQQKPVEQTNYFFGGLRRRKQYSQ